MNGTIWALETLENLAVRLAWVVLLNVLSKTKLTIAYNEQPVCTFICQFEDEFGSLLFVNRPVGNSDSHDWKIVEDYVANFGDGRLPWLPILRDIPLGLIAR